MPNYIHTTLTVKGPLDQVEAFRKKMAANDGKFSFQNLLPMPSELKRSDAWYDWAIEHWGTKWDALNVADTKMTVGQNGDGDIFRPL